MNSKRAFSFYTLLMFFSPALTLFHSLNSSLNIRHKRRLMIVFITIYGSIITVSESSDGYRLLENVYIHYLDLPFAQFISEIGDILLFKSTPDIKGDLYIHVLSYFTGTVIGLPSLFFVFVSFIYAYFFIGSLVCIFKSKKKETVYSTIFYGLSAIFILWKNIEGINSVRTWTGAWILFYGCINYYQTKNIKYLLLTLVPPLVHLAYFIMAIPAWIVLMAGVRHKLYIIIFVLSFGGTFIDQQIAFKGLSQTEVGQEKVHGYDLSREEYIERKLSEESNWYKKLQVMGLQVWGINILCFSCILFLMFRNNMTYLESNLFSIGLLTGALSNSSWFIASMANRSATLFGIFILATVVLLLKRNYFKVLSRREIFWQKFSFSLALILLIPFAIFQVITIIYFTSFYILIFPFMPWISNETNYSIREVIDILLRV